MRRTNYFASTGKIRCLFVHIIYRKSRRLSIDSTASSRKLSSSSITTASEVRPLPSVTLPGPSHLFPPLQSAGLPIDPSEDSTNPGRIPDETQNVLGLDTNLQRQQHGLFPSSPSSSNTPSGTTQFIGQSTPGSGFIDPASLNVASSSAIENLIDIPTGVWSFLIKSHQTIVLHVPGA